MSKESKKRLSQADEYFSSAQEYQTPHHPRAYGLVAKHIHDIGGSKKEYRENAKKMLKFDSTRDPRYSDHLLSSMASYGFGGTAIGAFVGGKKGAAIGAGLGGLVAGPLARKAALGSEKESVSAGKKMLAKKDIDDRLSKIYDAINNKNKGQ